MNVGALLAKLRGGPAYRDIVRNFDGELSLLTLAALGTASRGYWTRWREGGTISAIRINVGVQSGNMVLALARNSGRGIAAAPSGLVMTTGSVAVPAAGDQSISLGASYTVAPGDWVLIAADNTTATFRSNTTGGATDTFLAAGHAWRETLSGLTVPSTRGTLTAHVGRNIALMGV